MDVLYPSTDNYFDLSAFSNISMVTITDAVTESPIMQLDGKQRRDKNASRACVLCNQAHTACDNVRPCRRCVSRGIAHLCKDSEPRKRGRAPKLPEQYDLDLARYQQKRQAKMAASSFTTQLAPQQVPNVVPAPSNVVMFPTYDMLTVQNFDFDGLFTDGQGKGLNSSSTSLSTLLPPPVSSTVFVPNADNHSPETSVLYSPSPLPHSPPTPESPASVQSPDQLVSIVPDPDHGLACTPPELKFAAGQMEKVFTRLANRAGYTAITPEIKSIMLSMVQYYAPLVQQYGNNLLEMCPVRLLSVTQMINEMTLPVVVAGAYRVLTANAEFFEMSGLKKSQINSYSIFDIIHRDDVVNFVKISVDSVVNYREFGRVKVRITMPYGDMLCIISETVHRSHNGVPLFSSFTIVRIDDI